ncbi:MAG: LysM peptidoglycan-binding domain-containing protein [Pseudomonadota bacterium]
MSVLGVVVAGCSSGFQRFDPSIYQDANPARTAQNSYPGNLDSTTTASTGRKLVPLNPVAPNPVPQAVYHQPEPTFAANQAAVTQSSTYNQTTYQPQPVAVQQPTYQAPAYHQQAPAEPARQPLLTYTPPKPDYNPIREAGLNNTKTVTSKALPKPVIKRAQPKVEEEILSYTPPKPDGGKVHIPHDTTDTLKTASVRNVPEREGGWTSTGGTTITVRQGETLYNLSKRYGVPVSAIRNANGFSASDNLKSGQRIVIPNYIFSQNSAVSAPDNNPGTRAASAGTGYIGEARTANISVPTKRPAYYAARTRINETEALTANPYPNSASISQTAETRLQQSFATAQPAADRAGAYAVQSGDSLSKIAARHGTTVSALKRANGLSNNTIRIGQKLTIPSAGYDTTVTSSVRNQVFDVPEGVDPIVTGSLKNKNGGLGSVNVDEETPAPQRTGISQFRWPVKGRVVENFGASSGGKKNEGIDISVPVGTAVRAAENGVVIYTGSEISAYGNLILVRHDDDWVSAYAHNRDFEVKKGEKVRRGQIIARSGKSGNADRPKLHFELRKDSQAVNPKKYLTGA